MRGNAKLNYWSQYPAQGRGPTLGFHHIKSRVDTGLSKSLKSSLNSNLSRKKSASSFDLPSNRVSFGQTFTTYYPSHRPRTSQKVPIVRKTNQESIKDLKHDMAIKLLIEARNEIITLEEVVANQQSFIEACHWQKSSNGCRPKEPYNTNDEVVPLDNPDCRNWPSTSKQQTSNSHSMRSEETQTNSESNSSSKQLESRQTKEIVSEKMAIYMSNLEQELKRAREEMSDIQDQLIFAKMNKIKIDELNRKVTHLQKENNILQDSLSSQSLEYSSESQETLSSLQRTLKQFQLKAISAEEEKKMLELELVNYKEQLKRELVEKVELKSMVQETNKQIESFKEQLKEFEHKNCRAGNDDGLTRQLVCMEEERKEFLNEFSEMKKMLELIQSGNGDLEITERGESDVD